MRGIPGLVVVLLVELYGWVFLGFLGMIRLEDAPFRGNDFTPEAWAMADIPGRTAMTRDAIRHLPSRASEDEVERLLGKPHAIMPSHRLTERAPGTAVRVWMYTLDDMSYYDSNWLCVHFDQSGRMVAAVIGGA
jgi:hypothetical protein